jgi:excisionase family DNA binding protein
VTAKNPSGLTAGKAARPASGKSAPASPDDYLTVKEAARFLKCSKSFLDKRRCSGGGPSFTRAGRKILYRRVDLEAWTRQNRFENTSQYGQELK